LVLQHIPNPKPCDGCVRVSLVDSAERRDWVVNAAVTVDSCELVLDGGWKGGDSGGGER